MAIHPHKSTNEPMRTFKIHNSKFIIALLLAFLALVGCRTRKVATTEQRHVQKEHFITYKDSLQLFAYQAHRLQQSLVSHQDYELELETLTDSAGNPREPVYYRDHKGNKRKGKNQNHKHPF